MRWERRRDEIFDAQLSACLLLLLVQILGPVGMNRIPHPLRMVCATFLALALGMTPAGTRAADLPSPTPGLQTSGMPAPLAPTARTTAFGNPGGLDFEDVRSNGWLIGLNIAYGTFSGRKVIKGLQPIYATAGGRALGGKCGVIDKVDATVEAREGFVIAGLDIGSGERIEGFDVIFKRPVDQQHLQPQGSYTSDWYGGTGSGDAKTVSGDGRPIVGLFGKCGTELGSLGLIFRGVATSTNAPVQQPALATNAPPAAPRPPDLPQSGDLVKDYRDGLVFVEGAAGRGSGFICMMHGHKLLISNAHVLAGIQAPTFKLLDRSPIQVGAGAVAVGHDIAALAVTNGGKAFEVMENVDTGVAIGDTVMVLGNSEGAGVIHPLEGKIVGLGPNLVEIDAEFVPGNSGSPIIHKSTGKVIGVATYLMRRRYADDGSKAVNTEVRRFGYRLDSVKKWEPIVWSTFYAQAVEAEKIHGLTADLVKFLEDLAGGGIHPERHNNPVIRDRINQWMDVRKRRSVSARDVEMADANLISYMKVACLSDITQARQHLTYDYFIREMDKEKQEREEIGGVFAKVVSAIR